MPGNRTRRPKAVEAPRKVFILLPPASDIIESVLYKRYGYCAALRSYDDETGYVVWTSIIPLVYHIIWR